MGETRPRLPDSLPTPLLGLTLRQAQVIAERTRHDTIKETADALGIGHNTTKNHLWQGYGRLGVTSLIGSLAALGWLRVPGNDELVAMSAASRRLRLAIDEARSVLDRLEEPS